jgi:hypothetical protein
MIKLDGLQFLSELQALGEGVLLGLQCFVTKIVAEAGQEKLVLRNFPMSVMPSSLASAMVAAAFLTAVMVAGLLSVSHL